MDTHCDHQRKPETAMRPLVLPARQALTFQHARRVRSAANHRRVRQRSHGPMNISNIRRMIMCQAGGANKLGWFSWAAAICGAVVLLLMTAAAAYQFASGW